MNKMELEVSAALVPPNFFICQRCTLLTKAGISFNDGMELEREPQGLNPANNRR